jgi:large subunit ribosomal protein L5
MNYFKKYYDKNLKYNLINKFFYKNITELPFLKKVIVNFNCKTSEIKLLSSSILALEIITLQKGSLTKSKKSNIFLKLRKGQPIGCKLELSKNNRFNFLSKLVFEILPKFKKFSHFKYKTVNNKNTFTFKTQDILNFPELETNYNIFNKLKNLNITFVGNTKTSKEMMWLLKSFKIPF